MATPTETGTPQKPPATVIPPLGPLTALGPAGVLVSPNAPAALAAGVASIAEGVFGFVATELGHMVTGFVKTLIAALGKVNQAYIVGIVVAAVVVFVLLG